MSALSEEAHTEALGALQEHEHDLIHVLNMVLMAVYVADGPVDIFSELAPNMDVSFSMLVTALATLKFGEYPGMEFENSCVWYSPEGETPEEIAQRKEAFWLRFRSSWWDGLYDHLGHIDSHSVDGEKEG